MGIKGVWQYILEYIKLKNQEKIIAVLYSCI